MPETVYIQNCMHTRLQFHHMTDALMDLRWLPVRQQSLNSNYQTYFKTAPQSLCDLIVPYSNAREIRSNNKLLIKPCQYYIYSLLNFLG